MTRFLGLPWLVVLAVLVVWLVDRVPGYRHPVSDGAESIHLVKLVLDVTDPLVLLAAVGAAVILGGWRGILAGASFLVGATGAERAPVSEPDVASRYHAASRGLGAGARGLLWGAFALNAVYLVSFYWPEPPWKSVGLLTEYARIGYVKCGALVAVVAGCLVLLPSAERAAGLSGRVRTSVRRAHAALGWLHHDSHCGSRNRGGVTQISHAPCPIRHERWWRLGVPDTLESGILA